MRRRAAPKRELLPDPQYNSQLVTRVVNQLMVDGKKSVAERILRGAMELAASKATNDAFSEADGAPKELQVLQKVIAAVQPFVEVKSRRVGGATFQVPVEVRPARRLALGIRWLIDYSAKRGEKTMRERLANEMLDVLAGRGATLKKRSEVHQMAKANQAFAHFNWQKPKDKESQATQ